MNKRETRVINAFINCVKHGDYTFDYACLLIEDTQRYVYLSDDAKEVFYAEFEVTEEVVEEIPDEVIEDIPQEVQDENVIS